MSEASPKQCLDLFAGLGGFSQAFEESDEWEVVTVDIEERFDVEGRAEQTTLTEVSGSADP